MKVKVGSGNRILLPKQFIKDAKINLGDVYELCYYDTGVIQLIPANKAINNAEDAKQIFNHEPYQVVLNNKKRRPTKCKLYSNLEESKNFTTRKISECGLLVRTKTSYLKKACEQCKGELAKSYGTDNHPCKYNIVSNQNLDISKAESVDVINKNSSKIIINSLMNNIKKLAKDFDKNIDQIEKDFSSNKNIVNDNKIISAVYYNKLVKCKNCKEIVDSGFLIDDIFYCKQCAVEDFKAYLNVYKRNKKRRN